MTTLIADYDYPLPPELVAQHPLARRDASRLLVLRREGGAIHHASFRDLPQWLDTNDLLVVNDTRVFPARLRGQKISGGRVELLLHYLPVGEGGVEDVFGGGGPVPSPEPPPPTAYGKDAGARRAVPPHGQNVADNPHDPSQSSDPDRRGTAGRAPGGRAPSTATAEATYRGRLKKGQLLKFGPALEGKVESLPQPGVAQVRFFSLNGDVCRALREAGEMPLPPYIRRSVEEEDREGYQTVYAARLGAIACPTAGLHFTEGTLTDLAARGIETVTVTLHVGPGTFKPVKHQDYTRHRLEPEYFELSPEAAVRLNEARARGKRLTAVGTTSVRVVEHCAGPEGFIPQKGWCGLYIHSGYRFKAVDRMLTNFHLPRSTLLLLVCAFSGRQLIMRAYEEAVREKYRFYSYGDCMLII